MRSKKIFSFGFVCLIVVIVVATYLWYLYFHAYEGDVLVKNIRLEVMNTGKINYIDATPEDDASIIPIYYFRVKNHVNTSIKYDVLINDVNASMAADGCNDDTNFKRDELRYELKLNNQIVKTGLLSEVKNNILYTTNMKGSIIDSYSLKVWLDSNVHETIDRHYHYVVNIREIE